MSFQHVGIFLAGILFGPITGRFYGMPRRKGCLHNRNDDPWRNPPMVSQLSGLAREFWKLGEAGSREKLDEGRMIKRPERGCK